MKVVMLCGGQGTRLREETEYRPKPMVTVGGRPILWHIMKGLAHYGFKDFILCLGYKGEMIKEYFLNYEAMNADFTVHLGRSHAVTYHGAHAEQDFNVTLADTGYDTQTGGRLQRIRRFIEGETVMVTYGDVLCDVDPAQVATFHRSHGKLATITSVRPSSRYGVLDIVESGSVQEFAEKPQMEGWASAGFFVLEPGIFNYITGDDCTLERDPLETLARQGQLMAYRHHGFFYAMDTYREFKVLNEMWDRGEAPWRVWEEPMKGTLLG